MERLDKLLAGTGKWSRREVKALVRQGLVRVDGRLAASAEDKLDPAAAIITVAGETISLCRFTYVLLHKPAGVLTATEDRKQPTVLDFCRQSCAALVLPRWVGWTRTRRACCC